jgi:pyruvate/2-oxoglutarate dehydrogenase complex dihydrolipoamide dehydrogenase (E3) component
LYRNYQRRVLADLGVDVHTGVAVDGATVAAEEPDVLIVATGSSPFVPPIPGIDGPTVVDAQRVLLARHDVPADHHVVVIGGSATGMETAEFLMEDVRSVSLVEMLPTVGRGVELITRKRLYAELKDRGVDILTRCKVTSISEDAVTYEDDDGAEHRLPADTVVLAIGWRPTGESLVQSLDGTVDDIVMVGDAAAPGDFVAAVNAGADAGLGV